jgi:hypothetical protein
VLRALVQHVGNALGPVVAKFPNTAAGMDAAKRFVREAGR